MDAEATPLSYGVRQAIQDSPKTTYEIGTGSKISPRNFYRFLTGSRNLSQESLDQIGMYLKLKMTFGHASRLQGLGKDYRNVFGDSKSVVAIDKLIGGPDDDPLSVQLGRAVRLHRKGLEEIAQVIGVTSTQLYRFLDRGRGLSQARLDTLFAFLGLYVDGPPDTAATAAALRSFRKGAVYMAPRKKYIPPLPIRSAEHDRHGESGQPSGIATLPLRAVCRETRRR